MSVTTSAPVTCSATSPTPRDDTWHKRGRFALRVDARTETELGTLQGRAQINFDWTTGNASTAAGSSAIWTVMALSK